MTLQKPSNAQRKASSARLGSRVNAAQPGSKGQWVHHAKSSGVKTTKDINMSRRFYRVDPMQARTLV